MTLVAMLAVFCQVPASRRYEAPSIAGTHVIVDPFGGAGEVQTQ